MGVFFFLGLPLDSFSSFNIALNPVNFSFFIPEGPGAAFSSFIDLEGVATAGLGLFAVFLMICFNKLSKVPFARELSSSTSGGGWPPVTEATPGTSLKRLVSLCRSRLNSFTLALAIASGIVLSCNNKCVSAAIRPALFNKALSDISPL